MKQMFGALAGTPVGEMLNSVLKKISVVVGGSVSFSSASFGDVLTPSSLLSETAQRHLGTLFVAIRNQQAVRLNYQNARATSPRLRLVHPLHLACLDDRWFLLAYDPAARAMRTFILARIHGLEETAEAFDRPVDFDATKVLGGNLGAYTGTEDHVVKVKLRDAAAVQARERKWHHSQVNTERGDGALEIALRLNNLVDVQNAVLRWGPLAEAIEPMALRTQVREAFKLAAEQYGGGKDQGPMTND
jgi:predicted DNA-binding transcriptional regulator YafY